MESSVLTQIRLRQLTIDGCVLVLVNMNQMNLYIKGHNDKGPNDKGHNDKGCMQNGIPCTKCFTNCSTMVYPARKKTVNVKDNRHKIKTEDVLVNVNVAKGVRYLKMVWSAFALHFQTWKFVDYISLATVFTYLQLLLLSYSFISFTSSWLVHRQWEKGGDRKAWNVKITCHHFGGHDTDLERVLNFKAIA
jgi:hypothetical protein